MSRKSGRSGVGSASGLRVSWFMTEATRISFRAPCTGVVCGRAWTPKTELPVTTVIAWRTPSVALAKRDAIVCQEHSHNGCDGRAFPYRYRPPDSDRLVLQSHSGALA